MSKSSIIAPVASSSDRFSPDPNPSPKPNQVLSLYAVFEPYPYPYPYPYPSLPLPRCVQQLELDKITDKPWHIAASNALTGEGIDAGIVWLGEQMARRASSRK